MADPRFFKNAGPFSHRDLAIKLGGSARKSDKEVQLQDLSPLDGAGPADLTFFGSPKYADALSKTKAGACLIRESDLEHLPAGVAAVIVEAPDVSYIDAVSLFHPEELSGTISEAAHVAPSAKLEEGVTVEPGAVIGAHAEIGAGTLIGANVVIGHGVKIGRNCRIYPNCSVRFALVGDRVMIHPSASIGADGFGFSTSGEGHKRVPQLGRVILQDDVEIGASSTIDRGALDDTIIGEGTKIDNLVQIAHNCKIGRHCMIVSMVGISGSTTVGDFVTMGGKVGVVDHVTIGDFAIIAARAAVTKDLPGGNVYAGFPAKPFKEWQREKAIVRRLARKK
jgi:UDP-3-O-[3-hydroxymyristoyl] glucosamine N-acyltransferase